MDAVEVKKRSPTPDIVQFFKDNFNKDYIKSSSGIIKIGQVASMVTSFSALAHYRLLASTTTLIYYVFMTSTILISVADIFEYTAFVLSLNYKMKKLAPQCFKILITAFTVCSGVVLLILSSLLAVEADEVRSVSRQSNDQKCLKCGKINVAAVFGFFASILFAIEVIQQIIHHKRESMTSKQEVTQTEVTEFNPNDL